MPATPKSVSIGDPKIFKMGAEHLSLKDHTLAKLIATHGLIDFAPGGEMFQSLVESIIGQQLAWPAASAIISRLKSLYRDGSIDAESLHKTPTRKLRAAGVSPQKIRYLRDLSSRVVNGRLDLEELRTKPDAELLKSLDDVLGIGPWTVHMLLIFTLGRPDVLPVDDLGIRRAVQLLYKLPELPKPKGVFELAKPWHPYCSVASLYLWKHKDSL
jgi:DNA-3-methyladenine glycosylase II